MAYRDAQLSDALGQDVWVEPGRNPNDPWVAPPRHPRHDEWKRRNNEALKRAGVVDDAGVGWCDDPEDPFAEKWRQWDEAGRRERQRVRLLLARTPLGGHPPAQPQPQTGRHARAPRARTVRAGVSRRGPPSSSSDEDPPQPPLGGTWDFLARASARMVAHEARREARWRKGAPV